MTAASLPALGILAIFLGMLLSLEMGRRLGAWRLARDPEAARSGASEVEGAVFGLMALLIAFTFSGASQRFETRRQLIVEEANDIGTAWLRLDLLPPGAQPALRESFRQYLESRLEVYRRLPDLAAAKEALAVGAGLQKQIWSQAVVACRDSGSSPATMLLLPALNQMFDITTTRTVAAQTHAPALIYAMLGLLFLAGSLLVGYSMSTGKRHNWFHLCVFTLVMTLALYVILDFEFPSLGLIRLHAFDQVLVDLQQSMK
jgi:hypothetical protein